MRFAATITYDAAPDAVYAMLTDPAFQDRKLAGTGALEYHSSVEPSGEGAVIATTRTLPTDRVPDAFRSLLGGKVTVVQTESWNAPGADLSRSGAVTVQISGAPLKMTGSLTLASDGHGGTIETVNGELKASVPLIGGRIEKAVEPALRGAIEVEQRLGREWLAEHEGRS